ncbi:MAG: sugar transferase [Polyangiaceae bacterium]|nr:sugar transferase [Polyangiaceae bacterium]MCW5791023.1 sugar transferase [Polyangiaceae bacterium]
MTRSEAGGSELAKRALDLTLCALSAPLVLPVSLALGLAIRLESPGGALFRQVRVGRHGQDFTVFKLRTMVENAEHIGAGLYAEANDPRFTKVGLFARRFSLDELPQVLNILRGEMSWVGPRPALRLSVEAYPEPYEAILQVKPGLTGLAQINGRNALVRSARLAFDAEYARTWTVLGDIQILLKTFRVVLLGEGQLNDQSAADVEQ